MTASISRNKTQATPLANTEVAFQTRTLTLSFSLSFTLTQHVGWCQVRSVRRNRFNHTADDNVSRIRSSNKQSSAMLRGCSHRKCVLRNKAILKISFSQPRRSPAPSPRRLLVAAALVPSSVANQLL
eukprot:Protomagalhaensia_sp_Gyna_25__955@NODE_1462_length_1815_cov_6_106982_g1184_i0_p3_GENE_NODE_1462_length_1815_cov_6_106982_g1184_i0NODE_1462_length_1815_cov_6_106982_g1184_i0_p3_ORF_typecomplete_len127_score2_43AUX_IAA/PF02309_16/0_024Rieske/PF00355_26/0_15_NODE_1462_length_1815_cov_6_106982_g1184_i013091689